MKDEVSSKAKNEIWDVMQLPKHYKKTRQFMTENMKDIHQNSEISDEFVKNIKFYQLSILRQIIQSNF